MQNRQENSSCGEAVGSSPFPPNGSSRRQSSRSDFQISDQMRQQFFCEEENHKITFEKFKLMTVLEKEPRRYGHTGSESSEFGHFSSSTDGSLCSTPTSIYSQGSPKASNSTNFAQEVFGQIMDDDDNSMSSSKRSESTDTEIASAVLPDELISTSSSLLEWQRTLKSPVLVSHDKSLTTTYLDLKMPKNASDNSIFIKFIEATSPLSPPQRKQKLHQPSSLMDKHLAPLKQRHRIFPEQLSNLKTTSQQISHQMPSGGEISNPSMMKTRQRNYAVKFMSKGGRMLVQGDEGFSTERDNSHSMSMPDLRSLHHGLSQNDRSLSLSKEASVAVAEREDDARMLRRQSVHASMREFAIQLTAEREKN